MKRTPAPADVAGYISAFPPSTRKLLRQVRALIRKTAPQAAEAISYGIVGYKYHGMLIYFAAFTHHIGLYPGAKAIVHFRDRLTKYKTAKGTVQFPLDSPLPAGLIRDIVRWRMRENEVKARK
jgi:uncharacterized protein YdhG (YjbR/CyaY superfamily)